MPAKLPTDVLTYRDLQIFTKHETEGKTLDKTAEEMGVSRDTVKRTKKKAAYRDLVLDAMEKQGFQVENYVEKLVGLTSAEKEINIGGDLHYVPDNTTQMKAIEKIGKVYGDAAPVDIDLSSSLARSSDEELFEEFEDALGRLPVESDTSEHGEGESDSGEIEGTIL